MPDKRIAVVLEDLEVRDEVIQYATALANRIGARVSLLLFLPFEHGAGPGDSDAVARGESLLAREARNFAAQGVPATYAVNQGEPRSEFIKFMATHVSFHTVVWGGDPRALGFGTDRRSDHWIATVRHEISCPLVTPTRKASSTPEARKGR